MGALCQPARDAGRLDPGVQRWKASTEASVIIRDFLTHLRKGVSNVSSSCSVQSCLLWSCCSVCDVVCSDGRVWGAWAGMGVQAGWAEPEAAHGSGSRAHIAGLCPSRSASDITEFHASAFNFGCFSAHLCSCLLSGWRQALGTEPRLSLTC